MRTTVDLDEPLLARAKLRAAGRGQTLSELVQEAVSSYLAVSPRREPEKPFELITCGEAGGRAPTAAEMASDLESDDERVAAPRRRGGRP